MNSSESLDERWHERQLCARQCSKYCHSMLTTGYASDEWGMVILNSMIFDVFWQLERGGFGVSPQITYCSNMKRVQFISQTAELITERLKCKTQSVSVIHFSRVQYLPCIYHCFFSYNYMCIYWFIWKVALKQAAQDNTSFIRFIFWVLITLLGIILW